MSTLTKEWLQQAINDYEGVRDEIPFGLDEYQGNILAALRIALASLEAEPVAWIWRWSDDEEGFWRYSEERKETKGSVTAKPLYAAPPAPVVPDMKELVAILDWILMLPCPTPKATLMAKRLAVVIDACRAAMLQGAEQPQSAQQNIPEIIPGGLVKAVNNLLNNDGSRGRYSAIGCGEAREKIELWLAQRQKWESQRSENLCAGNSPVIPDGWVMVPVEPTEDMIVNGFESEPDESFSDEKEWEAYDAMSGCQQAAHRAKLCWAAMIATAPKV